MRAWLAIGLALWCSATTAAAPVVVAARDAKARVIVAFKPDSTLMKLHPASTESVHALRAKALGTRLGLGMVAGASVSEAGQVMIASGLTSAELAARLEAQDDVAYAVPDERRQPLAVPNDPLYATGDPVNGPAAGQWYLRPPTGAVKAAIDAQSAWDVTIGNPGVIVAVVDTGVRYEHPDLRTVPAGGNLLPGYDMVADAQQANDGDGRDADASDPGDWVTQAELDESGGLFYQCKKAPSNSSWHGTQVAGLIAALTDNRLGMASVGRTVRVLPVRVLGKCGGYDSDIIAGMRWAAGLTVPGAPGNANVAHVINLSLGGEGSCNAAYQQAVAEITSAGVAIVAAAGNSAGHQVGVPGNCSGVISVAALRHAGTKVGFSDLGPEVALSAPGGNCVNTATGTPCLYPILTTITDGLTIPGTPTYSDGVKISVGTSFSAPLVAGTIALMRSVRPALSVAELTGLLKATTRPFPTTGGDNGDGTVVPQCTVPQYDAGGTPVDQAQCYCTSGTCGAGMLDAGAAVLAAANGGAVAPARFEGLWWKSPGGSESGWGLNIAQQGEVIFATWFTYDHSGRAWWLSMTGTAVAANTFAGTLYATRGPPFNASPFDPAKVIATAVGSATLTFADGDVGTFAYTVNGVSQTKAITRDVFGDVPACTFGLLPDPAFATNVQDLWWNAPSGSESGWGINLVQQGDVVFATWFTYDLDGSPLWLSMTASASGPGRYAGTLYRTTGPSFDAVPFDPAGVVLTAVGTGALTFTSGNAASFAYTVNGIAQEKNITRYVFRAPGTVCR